MNLRKGLLICMLWLALSPIPGWPQQASPAADSAPSSFRRGFGVQLKGGVDYVNEVPEKLKTQPRPALTSTVLRPSSPATQTPADSVTRETLFSQRVLGILTLCERDPAPVGMRLFGFPIAHVSLSRESGYVVHRAYFPPDVSFESLAKATGLNAGKNSTYYQLVWI